MGRCLPLRLQLKRIYNSCALPWRVFRWLICIQRSSEIWTCRNQGHDPGFSMGDADLPKQSHEIEKNLVLRRVCTHSCPFFDVSYKWCSKILQTTENDLVVTKAATTTRLISRNVSSCGGCTSYHLLLRCSPLGITSWYPI